MSVTNASMVFGDSGSGKSSLLATLAEWGWKKHKKVSLLYSTDGGGFPTKMDALIRAGIVRVWKLRTRGDAFESCSRACQGWWPSEFIDPIAGEVTPGVKLTPSLVTTFSLHCPNCGEVVNSSSDRRVFQQVYSCTKCMTKVNLTNGQVEEASTVSPFFKDVGILLYDGLTSMNDWIMGDMSDMTARGVLKGENAAIGGVIRQGDMSFSGSNRSHYGYAQVRSAQWLQDAANVQGLVIGPVITARKQRATDSNSNIKVYGPAIAGNAKTSDVPAWVGNCLGATTLIDEKGKKEWRLYLTEYREPGDDILHLCKTRAAPGTVPEYLSDGPIEPDKDITVLNAKAFTHFNLGHFMDIMENATKKTLEETSILYPDAPGLNYLQEAKEVPNKVEPEAKQAKPVSPVTASKPKPPVTRPVPLKTGPRPGKK